MREMDLLDIIRSYETLRKYGLVMLVEGNEIDAGIGLSMGKSLTNLENQDPMNKSREKDHDYVFIPHLSDATQERNQSELNINTGEFSSQKQPTDEFLSQQQPLRNNFLARNIRSQQSFLINLLQKQINNVCENPKNDGNEQVALEEREEDEGRVLENNNSIHNGQIQA